MAMCWWCDLEALEGHLTCGGFTCSETEARTAAHMARKEKLQRQEQGPGPLARALALPRPRAWQKAPPTEALAVGRCGAENRHMKLSCALPAQHASEHHASGGLVWRGGERPRQADNDQLAALGPQAEPSDTDRLATLTQALITARSQMLGLGEGLRAALENMPRAIDQQAVRGLVNALGHIVQHLDSHKIVEGETVLRPGVKLGADGITASAFDRGPRKLPSSAQVAAEVFEGMQRRVQDAEASLDRLERAVVEDRLSPELQAFVALCRREDELVGPLDAVERAALVEIVGLVLGESYVPHADEARAREWVAACRRLVQRGYLHESYRPTARGLRLGLVLLGDRLG